MMRAASRRALEHLRGEGEQALRRDGSAAQFTALAEQLYAIADLLVAQPRLRRTLGDASTDPQRRTALVQQLLGGQVDDAALQVTKAAVEQRWSSPWDLADALEGTGDDALFAAAEQEGDLDQVEDDLFRFERILQADGEFTALLDEYTVPPERRVALLDSVVVGKVSGPTLALLQHAVRSQRKRSITLAIDNLLEHAAARRERSVARVTAAAPLTATQEQRLAATLSQMYGRPISIRTALDPGLRGGLIVRVGDEVIDGSIASRVSEIRAGFAG